VFALPVVNKVTDAVIVVDCKHFLAKWAFKLDVLVGIHIFLSYPPLSPEKWRGICAVLQIPSVRPAILPPFEALLPRLECTS
jgi:hypothetical protein